MKKETLKFGEGIVEITLIDNIIYMKTLCLYHDEIAMEMTRYLDKIIDQIPGNPIRVWDSTDLSSEFFKLTNECVKKIVNWSQKIKGKKPGSKAYFIAPEPLIFGISRMYEMQAKDEIMDVIVLNSIDELPKEIRAKILV